MEDFLTEYKSPKINLKSKNIIIITVRAIILKSQQGNMVLSHLSTIRIAKTLKLFRILAKDGKLLYFFKHNLNIKTY